MRKIGLFGGTFDPVHLGHLHLAETAKNAVCLDEVRFIPCRISPHKTGSHPSTAEDRLEMLRLALDGISWAVVDDIEVTRSSPSYSYETAETIAARYPDAKLYWIMGFDQWNALPTWKHPERLSAVVDFIVLARSGSPASRDGYRMQVAVASEHPASATVIRAALATRQDVPPWLHPGVLEWIRTNRRYAP